MALCPGMNIRKQNYWVLINSLNQAENHTLKLEMQTRNLSTVEYKQDQQDYLLVERSLLNIIFDMIIASNYPIQIIILIMISKIITVLIYIFRSSIDTVKQKYSPNITKRYQNFYVHKKLEKLDQIMWYEQRECKIALYCMVMV